jgi:hypothetical protein
MTKLSTVKGYDHTWVIRSGGNMIDHMNHAATLRDPGSGRKMDIYTDQPGIQFYSGNYLDGSYAGQSGKIYPYVRGCVLKLKFFQIAQIIRERMVGRVVYFVLAKLTNIQLCINLASNRAKFSNRGNFTQPLRY